MRLRSRATPARGRLSPLEELEALHETALALVEHLDLETVLRAIVERASRLVGTTHGYLYLTEPEGGVITLRVGTGRYSTWVGAKLRPGAGLSGRVWEAGAPLVVEDYTSWEGRSPQFDGLVMGTVVGVPLQTASGVVGVLGLGYVEERGFGSADLALLARFGRLASLALENARLYETARADLFERRRTEEELLDTVARLRRSEHELGQTREEMIRRLASAAEFRSAETGAHIDRVSRYCALLGQKLGLDDERCELLRVASPLHDIGKIAVPDSVLLKPGPLSLEERRTMEKHAEIGHTLLTGSSSELLELAAAIAWTHHERYDGNGYPRGLAGAEIPLEGRIAAVADVFEALTSERVYRPAFALEEAIEIMRAGRGTQFDPFILDLFLDSIDELDLDDRAQSAHGTRARGRARSRT